mgnify:CR=1 FL=1
MRASDFRSFHEASKRSGVILSFGGDLSENILFSLGEVLKLRMRHEETDAAVAKRVFSIFVEQAQNVIRYSADKVAPAEPPGPARVSAGRWEGALNSYRGAVVVVSHDERFLAEIGVNRWLRLADGTLTETGAPEV